jgi:hypothetical protein
VNLTTKGANIAVMGDSTISANGPGATVILNTGTTGGTITVASDSTGDPVLTTANFDGTVSAGSVVSFTTGSSAATLPSSINLTDASITADMLKIQALGTAGQITIGGSSVLTGNSQLELYAGNLTSHTGGLIDFVANTTLTSNVAGTLAAATITIANGVDVTVNSPSALNIYGNNLNYSSAGGNSTTTGTFTGTGAPTVASTAPFSSAPAPSVVKGGHVVATWNIGGHRITAISTPVAPQPAGSKAAPAVKFGSVSGKSRLGAREAVKTANQKQTARNDAPNLNNGQRPGMVFQR